jgi:signal transduction histidine kinase/ActR/RegA family two-component response regulator
MQARERVIVDNVLESAVFAGTPALAVLQAAGVRAVQSTPLITRTGRMLGMFSTHYRTPHRPTERELHMLDVLARQAADLIENKQAEEALREADRRKDEFLAILAHELRNPLAPLRTGLQVMKLARNDATAVEQSRTMMERQLDQMVRLIDDLMDLSRISRGKIVLQMTRVLLATVVRNAVETSRPLIETAGHDLTLDVPDEPIYVNADATRLSQVFANLLNNAAKYTDRGGRIRLAFERQGSDAVISVEDNGVGIPAPMLPKVFDMFTQVDHSLEKAQGGLGIGLNIVKRLVEMHGGTIQAQSGGHGAGSTFTVRLPVVLSLASEPSADGAAVKAAPVARRRILVVDDNRDAAVSLAMMLNIMGNETQAAHDGLEALGVAAAFRPDVILLDIGMPKLNGYDTARRMRREPWGKAVVLVALTGWGQEEDKHRSQEAGFDLHLVKPVEPAALEQLLAGLKCETG